MDGLGLLRPAGVTLPRGGASVAPPVSSLQILVALAVRSVNPGHPPCIDELNHVFAAGSLLEDGTLTIHDGVAYARARLFTRLVAGFFFLLARVSRLGFRP